MTIQDKYNAVREAIIKANPSVYKPTYDITIDSYPITLEDILLTFVNHPNKDADWRDDKCHTVVGFWELGVPLNNQEDNVVEWLYDNLI